MRRIHCRGARDVGGDDVDLLAAETPVYLGGPYGRATLGGEKEFGEDEQTIHDNVVGRSGKAFGSSVVIVRTWRPYGIGAFRSSRPHDNGQFRNHASFARFQAVFASRRTRIDV
jgi:hypothetical protein